MTKVVDRLLEDEAPATQSAGAPKPPDPSKPQYWVGWRETSGEGISQNKQKKFFATDERTAFIAALKTKKGFMSVSGQGQGDPPKVENQKIHALIRALIE